MSFVDYRDVAEVAALALAGDDLVDGAFELAAGGMLTRTEIAAMISRHAGAPSSPRTSTRTWPWAACPRVRCGTG